LLTFDGFNKAIKYVLSPSPNQHALANHALSPEVSIAGDSPPNQHPIIFCHSEQARTQGTILILPRSPETCSTSFIQTACTHVVAWMPRHCQVRAFHFRKAPGRIIPRSSRRHIFTKSSLLGVSLRRAHSTCRVGQSNSRFFSGREEWDWTRMRQSTERNEHDND